MATTKAVVSQSYLTDIANAIITKGGATAPLKPSEMADAIANIPTGGGEGYLKDGNAALGYVADGCVFHLNGYDNEGTGAFNPSATVWKELVGGLEFQIVNCNWTDDHGLICKSSDYVSSIAESTQDVGDSLINAFTGRRTIELVCVANNSAWGNSNTFVKFGTVSTLTCGRAATQVSMGCTSMNGVVVAAGQSSGWKGAISFGGNDRLRRSVALTEAYNYRGYDIQYPSSVGFTTSSPSSLSLSGKVSLFTNIGYGAVIYAVRVYNRMLSVSEIAQNFAVDKQRFNLNWM